MIETHFHAKILHIRTDNGTEFIQSSYLDFFNSKGILHQKSIVHTPQQNGVAERKHRHLLDTARALRFHAHLPKSFWSECVLSATYIINRLPMSNLAWKSPYEALHGKPPNYASLRTMGCLCFAANVGERDKFTPRALKCIFWEYTFGLKGYKLYDLQAKKIFYSRDVLFREHVFPFKLGSSPHTATPDATVTGSVFPSIASLLVPTSPHLPSLDSSSPPSLDSSTSAASPTLPVPLEHSSAHASPHRGANVEIVPRRSA